MATLSEIQSKIQKLQAQAEEIAKKQSSTVIAKIRELMAKHGLTIADIGEEVRESRLGRKATSSKVGATSHEGTAKYRDPKTGATWTGHGRAPAWIANAKNRNLFLVDGQVATPPVSAAKQPKAGNYVRGPQAPKYRDPKTGSTWSGRGKAPAWLASAKDRTTYLIDKVNDETAASDTAQVKTNASKKVAGKKAGTKGVAAKKVASKKVAKKAAAAKKAVSKTTSAKKASAKKSGPTGKKVPAKKSVSGAEVPPLATEPGNTETDATTIA